MDKKVKSKSGKKRYSKPQITQVKLAITEASLTTCWASGTTSPSTGVCESVSGCWVA